MSRPIKFRAWDYEMNDMIAPQNLHDLGTGDSIDTYMDRHKRILMQFTGLFDKNGKEIWEGDIVRVYDYEYRTGACYETVCSIVWNKTDAMFEAVGEKSYMLDCVNSFEVLGNIHQNPELLK